MTDRDTLLALAERVERASGPDRLIDTEIADELSEWRNLGGYWEEHKVTGERRTTSYPPAPAYTASLDASLTLVPDDPDYFAMFALEHDAKYGGGIWTARFDTHGDECGHGDTIICEARSAPLAVTAACLRARATETSQ